MILEAFSEYLHSADSTSHASEVLARWLYENLSKNPESTVEKVIHMEIAMFSRQSAASQMPGEEEEGQADQPYRYLDALVFKGSSDSGERLLRSLEEFCLSYEQQKMARWLHETKASDFKKKKRGQTCQD